MTLARMENLMLDDPSELFNTIPGVDETLAEIIDFKQSVSAANWRTPGEHYQLMPQVTRRKVDRVVKSDERMRAAMRKDYFPALEALGTLKRGHRNEHFI